MINTQENYFSVTEQDGHHVRIHKSRWQRHIEIIVLASLSIPFVSPYSFSILQYILYAIAAVILALLSLVLIYSCQSRPKRIEAQRAVSFRPDQIPKKIDTIVIGSGSGGSTCANLLAQMGQRVLVLEQHPTATGGCTHSFRKKNCEWDTGLHYTSKDMSNPAARPGAIMNFMSLGKQEWTPLEDPYDEVLFPDDDNVRPNSPNYRSYPFVSGVIPTIDEIMKRVDPKDKVLRQRVVTYMSICKEINAGFTALAVSRILPSRLHFLLGKKLRNLMKYASFTVRDVQHAVLALGYSREKILASETLPKCPDGPDSDCAIRRLKGILCHPIGDYAVQPREATMAAHGVTMAHYLGGASYTVGATQKISIRLTSMVRNFGGEVFVDAMVRNVIIENGRAVGVRVTNTSVLRESGETDDVPVTEIRAKNIVCATSIYNLYGKLLPQNMAVVKKFHDPSQRTVRQSHGHIFLFCKIDGDATDLKLPTHNLWYFNNYDLDTAFDEYFKDPTNVRPPTVYIGFPCTKDTTWKKRFPHVSNCILISDGLYEWFEKWADKPCKNRGSDYTAFKEKLTRHLLDILYECVPQVRGKIDYHDLGTPLSEITYLGSYHGGSYGTKCVTEMFAPVNHEWTTTPHTSVPGLYLAGSDAFLPAVAGAMYGGALGACAILGHLGTLRLGITFFNTMAKNIRQEDPSVSVLRSYQTAWRIMLK